MKPVDNFLPGREDEIVQVGKDQPEFQTLPTIFFRDEEGAHALNCWTFEDDDERHSFIRTGRIYISQLTGGGAPRPIRPSVYLPEVPPRPDPSTVEVAADAGEAANPFQAVVFEFRVVPLDRQTGNPISGFESGGRVYVDFTSFALALNTVAPEPPKDAIEVLDKYVEGFARTLATVYGADVYFQLYGSAEGWRVIEGKLESGAHVGRTIRASNAGLPDVRVAVLDVAGGASFRDAVRMMQALRDSFAGPFRLLGFSQADNPPGVQALGERLTSAEFGTLPEVVGFFRASLRPSGDYCLLIQADSPEDELKRGAFLLDVRIFEKSQSN